MSEIILLGAGGHARSCIDVIKEEKIYKIAGLIVQSDKLELVGGNESYKAVCRRHLESMDVQNKNDSFLKTAFNKAVKSRMVK